eukprot:c46179_g1_i1 orf=1-240(-)
MGGAPPHLLSHLLLLQHLPAAAVAAFLYSALPLSIPEFPHQPLKNICTSLFPTHSKVDPHLSLMSHNTHPPPYVTGPRNH